MNRRAQINTNPEACDFLGMAEIIEPVDQKEDKDDMNLHMRETCTLSPKSAEKQVISFAEER